MADEIQLDVLAAAPHPDDLEICCGGTLAKLAKLGHKVGMVHLTDGEPTPSGTREQRMAEHAEAARILGVTVHETLDLPNRELMDTLENRYKLATVLRRYRPRILLSLYGRTPTASPDHYQSQLLCEAARFYSKLTKWDDRFAGTPPHTIDHLIYFPVPTCPERPPLEWKFIVDISDTIEQKMAAVAAYKTQFDGPRFERLDRFIRSINGACGGLAMVPYAELFASDRPIVTDDPLKLFPHSS